MTAIISMKFSNASTFRNVTRPIVVGRRHAGGPAAMLVVEDEDEHDGSQVEQRATRNACRRPTSAATTPPTTGPERRAEALRRLHGADRLRHLAFRRRVRRHRQRQRAVAGEEPLDRAQREHLPRRA